MKCRRFCPAACMLATVVVVVGLQRAVAVDCNRNGIPDRCDVNCGLAGCLQYACNRSDDANPQNDVPDECDGVPAIGTFTATTDFITSGTLINLHQSVGDQLSSSEMPRAMSNLWVGASNRGTIVRMSTVTGEVLGEYFSAPDERGRANKEQRVCCSVIDYRTALIGRCTSL